MPHAFKDLLIPGTPQFILNIAVRYVLHHYSSQDIHHCKILKEYIELQKICIVLKVCKKTDRVKRDSLIIRNGIGFVRMILPQVHLRKPCYDFSFL